MTNELLRQHIIIASEFRIQDKHIHNRERKVGFDPHRAIAS